MKNIQYTRSPGIPHQSMAEEFLCHRNGSEWWYCTGYLNDETGKLYTFQFTLARVRIYSIQFNILMTAVTDFETRKHYYAQYPIFFGRDVTITPEKVGWSDVTEMKFSGKEIILNMKDKEYFLNLKLDATKPPVWHCEDGKLKMGVDRPKETTYYWSYTNLAASGELNLEGKAHKVTGKAWFDKQGGTYTLTNRWTNWEWFSLRFFDGEELMLFSFPQDDYRDGTYIKKDGSYSRLNDYSIEPLDFTTVSGNKFSFGWKVEIKNTKDKEYTIVPKIEGQLNMFYFELLADIKDKTGKTVGYCVAELLPGVYNEISGKAAFARVK